MINITVTATDQEYNTLIQAVERLEKRVTALEAEARAKPPNPPSQDPPKAFQ